jgi:hypothetical protein
MLYKNVPSITVGKDDCSERLANVIDEAFAGDALNRAPFSPWIIYRTKRLSL